jgi:putative oxidoreductase
MIDVIFPRFLSGRAALGLLLVRVVTGVAFMFHGWYKAQSPGGVFGWMGPDAGVPGIAQGLAVFAELGGGLLLALGLMTPLAALALAGTMVVALAMEHIPSGHPFVAAKPGAASFELAAGYLANVILLLLAGPGMLSADYCLFGRRHAAVRS